MPDKTDGQKMVEEFQCPGCVCGVNIECGQYKTDPSNPLDHACLGHVIGTSAMGRFPRQFALGLPKGFNRFQRIDFIGNKDPVVRIRLLTDFKDAPYNQFNIPVWAMEQEGYLLVRTYAPRVDWPTVEVIKDATLDLLPDHVIDVGTFHDEID